MNYELRIGERGISLIIVHFWRFWFMVWWWGGVFCLAVVIPIPTSLCGGPFSSELLLGFFCIDREMSYVQTSCTSEDWFCRLEFLTVSPYNAKI